MRPDRLSRGVTLVELLLVMSIVVVIFAVTQLLLARTLDSWWRVNANADAQQQLYKAQNFLERDLASAAYEREEARATVGILKAPAELVNLAGADGDVLWFLSAVDPASGRFIRLDGKPFWQRNIVYYSVTPTSLETFGFTGPGLNLNGYESACPFKALIRKEIDFGAPTRPDSDPADVEPLLAASDLLPYLTRPAGYDVSHMATPEVAVQPIAGNVLNFKADFDDGSRGITLEITSTAIDRARREGPLGSRNLSTDPATRQLQLTLFPPNRQGNQSTLPH